ncbi:MAG TPA: TonB-dependent receptor, partial [Steroidobacter sp.]|nr:TonB-dependent receptor [Steroidobacter sp.]
TSAAGFEQIISDAPASISVISKEMLEERPFTDFTDIIREVPGAAITNGEGRNVDISLRGMPPGYTLILIDGKRQNLSGVARNGNNNVKQSFMPPLSAIERIEVIRGPMSTLYGSDAMGGVINVITKKAADRWGGEFSADYMSQEDSKFGDARGLSMFLNGPVIADKVGIQVTGREQVRDEDAVARGEPHRVNRNLTGRVWITPTKDHDIMLEHSREYFEMDAWITGRSVGENWHQETRREASSIAHTGRWSFGTSEIVFQKEDVERSNITADNWTLDAKLMLPWEIAGTHFTTVGTQLTSNKVDSWAIQDVNGRVIDVIERKNKAFFVEDEWGLTDAVALTLGLRFDDPEDFSSHISPRAYVVWNTTSNLTLKAGVATGFQAPRADYVAPGLVTESESSTTGALSYTYSNPDMDPETSTNYEISAIWQGGNGTNVSLTLFRTDFKDKLDSLSYLVVADDGTVVPGAPLDPLGYCNAAVGNYGCTWSERVNVDEAVNEGVELTVSTPLISTVSMNASYTYLQSEEKTGPNAGSPLSGSPRHNLVTTFNWDVTDRFTAWASYSFRTRLRQSNRPAPGCFN